MRKIITERDLTEAIGRIDRGEVTQKEVAESLGVSPSALNQRIKKIKSYAVPESFQHLTDKQKRFVLAKVEGKNNLEAVKTAYDVTSDASGKSMGTMLMKDPDVGVAIQDLMAQVGISKRYRIQRIKDMIDSPDLNVAGKGLDMSFKLGGDYAPEKHANINIGFDPVDLSSFLNHGNVDNQLNVYNPKADSDKEN